MQALVVAISTSKTPHRIQKVAYLLNGVKYYIVNNISRRVNIIEDIWELDFHLRKITQRFFSFIDYLKRDLEHDRHFVDNELSNFTEKINSPSKLRRSQWNLL